MNPFLLVLLVLDIYVILKIMKAKISQEKKLLWLLIVVVLPLVGAVLWLLLGNKSRS